MDTADLNVPSDPIGYLNAEWEKVRQEKAGEEKQVALLKKSLEMADAAPALAVEICNWTFTRAAELPDSDKKVHWQRQTFSREIEIAMNNKDNSNSLAQSILRNSLQHARNLSFEESQEWRGKIAGWLRTLRSWEAEQPKVTATAGGLRGASL